MSTLKEADLASEDLGFENVLAPWTSYRGCDP